MRWCHAHENGGIAAYRCRKFMGCAVEFDHIIDAVLYRGKESFMKKLG